MGVTDWKEWSDAVAAGVRGVPDEALALAAATLSAASLVLTAGNGGSAALASHAAQALMKPGYEAGGGRAAICLTDSVPALTAHANDGGWSKSFVELGRPFLRDNFGVALWLFSSSGSSANVVALAELARQHYRPIVAFTGFGGEPLKSLATVSAHVDSRDYEVVEPVHDALLHRVQYHLRARKLK